METLFQPLSPDAAAWKTLVRVRNVIVVCHFFAREEVELSPSFSLLRNLFQQNRLFNFHLRRYFNCFSICHNMNNISSAPLSNFLQQFSLYFLRTIFQLKLENARGEGKKSVLAISKRACNFELHSLCCKSSKYNDFLIFLTLG